MMKMMSRMLGAVGNLFFIAPNGTHVCEVVNLKKIIMKKAEEILREYIEFYDVNGSETVELLPLTIVDIMEEYASQFRKHDVSGSVCCICGDELSCLRCTNPLTEQIKL